MKNFLSVQEFAKLTGVEVSKLKYWDRIGIFSPIQRNPENNYRNYSPVQIFALNFVSILSDLGVPLKTIAKLRKERDPDKILRALDNKEKEMDMELRNLRVRSSIIHARRELINYGLKVASDQISVLHRDDKRCILWPRNEYKEGDTFVEPLMSFINRAEEFNINLNFPIGGYYESMESFRNAPGRPDHFFSVDPTGPHHRKDGDYIIAMNRGSYGELEGLPEKITAYADENGYICSGPVYIFYLFDELCIQEPHDYLAQACVSISKQRRRP